MRPASFALDNIDAPVIASNGIHGEKRMWWRERQDFRAHPHAQSLLAAVVALVRLPLPQESDPAPGSRACQWARRETMGTRPGIGPGRSGSRSGGRIRPGRPGAWRCRKWRCRMNLTSRVVDIVILFVIIAIGVSVVRAWRSRPARGRLTTLPSEERKPLRDRMGPQREAVHGRPGRGRPRSRLTAHRVAW